MTLTVERFTGSPAEWDTFVRFAETGTQCHLWGWKSVIERVLGHECIYLVARAPDGRVAGVLPLVRVSSPLFGSYLVSMPFLNYGGALGSDGAVQVLVARALEIARSGDIELLEMRSRHPLPVELPVSHRKITVVRDLAPGRPAQVWDSLRAKVRSQIRRPQKEGIVVRFGPDQVGPFFLVFSRHMRDLGTPTQSRRLFEAAVETFPAQVWFGCAYAGAYPVAAGCGFRWNGEFEMTWAASLAEYNAIAPNMLLYWAFMERAAEQGLATFNFGRCSPGSGTHRFKQQWGGRDEPLWWYQHTTGRRAATPSPDDKAFSWGPRVWKRLPLPIANMLGPRVVRLIP
ncbi:MAG TPA: FemAB family XrtA/PEP-CTERM system-associated protein [Gemmatimonadales bacterium]|jgi:FemAB-related protein (PEP-CTERM system-associated)